MAKLQLPDNTQSGEFGFLLFMGTIPLQSTDTETNSMS